MFSFLYMPLLSSCFTVSFQFVLIIQVSVLSRFRMLPIPCLVRPNNSPMFTLGIRLERNFTNMYLASEHSSFLLLIISFGEIPVTLETTSNTWLNNSSLHMICSPPASINNLSAFLFIFATKLERLVFMGNSVNASFSAREREIADLLARGLSEKEIAEKLFISPATVNNHTRNIREKFGLNKNSEIVLLYIAERNGKKFCLKNIREFGIGIILVLINICEFNKGF